MGTFLRFVIAALLLSFVTSAPAVGAEWRDVTADRLLNAETDPANWLMYNRTYNGWRYSPLDQISTGNVKKLVPKWIFAGGSLGDQQMTPVVNDGVMFTTSTALAFNRVHAVNAATGELLWKHERKIPEDVGALVRVIPPNRGVADLAYKKGQLFTGVTVEHFSKTEQAGVLRAFDVAQNKVVWEWSNRTPLISHTLSTGGDLVFQGTAEGKVVAVSAKDGQELWAFNLGTPQSGGIISYAVDGKQYIAVAAGGTLRSLVWFGKEPKWAHATRMNFSDIVVVFGLSD